MSLTQVEPVTQVNPVLKARPEGVPADAVESPRLAFKLGVLGRILAIAGGYFLTGELAVQISFHQVIGVSVWPPTGVGLAALLLWGWRLWPGILLGQFAFNLIAGQSLGTSLFLAVGYTAEVLVATGLANWLVGGCRFFRSPVAVIKFSGAMVLASLIGPSVEVLVSRLGLATLPSEGVQIWLPSCLGELLSLVVGAPLLMAWSLRPQVSLSRGGATEFALVLLMLVLASGSAFGTLMSLPGLGFLHSFMFLPLLIWVAFRFGTREMATAAFLLGVVALWGTLHGKGIFNRTRPHEALYVCQMFIVLNAVAGLTVASLVAQRARAVAEVSETNRALQDEMEQRRRAVEAHQQIQRRLAQAEETERSRISRELHDQFGQDLTALKLGLQLLRKREGLDPALRESVGHLEQLSDELMRHIHRLAWQLRPTALDDFGLEMAVRRYGEEWSRLSGVPLDFHSQGLESGRLSAEVETALYRVTQEALTNVLRHARAQRVSVLLERKANLAALIVEDDGQGFDPEAPGANHGGRRELGLLGMRERLMLAGGSLNIESTPGVGTTIFARIPLPEPTPTSRA